MQRWWANGYNRKNKERSNKSKGEHQYRKEKNRQSELILIAVYLVIWAVLLIVFWFFTSGSDGMGYSLMFLYILLPVTTFVISLLIGKNNYWGRWKWASVFVFGIMYMLAEYGTFNIANMIAFGKINVPSFEMILVGGFISALGLGTGSFLKFIKSKSKWNISVKH